MIIFSNNTHRHSFTFSLSSSLSYYRLFWSAWTITQINSNTMHIGRCRSGCWSIGDLDLGYKASSPPWGSGEWQTTPVCVVSLPHPVPLWFLTINLYACNTNLNYGQKTQRHSWGQSVSVTGSDSSLTGPGSSGSPTHVAPYAYCLIHHSASVVPWQHVNFTSLKKSPWQQSTSCVE